MSAQARSTKHLLCKEASVVLSSDLLSQIVGSGLKLVAFTCCCSQILDLGAQHPNNVLLADKLALCGFNTMAHPLPQLTS